MNRKTILLLGIVFATLFSARVFADDSFWIAPTNIVYGSANASVGTRFNVTVWMSFTDYVAGWQALMRYNRTQLRATNAGFTNGNDSRYFIGKYVVHTFISIDGSGGGPYGNGSIFWDEYLGGSPPPEGGGVSSNNDTLVWAEFEILDTSKNQTSEFYLPETDIFALDNYAFPVGEPSFSSSSYTFLYSPCSEGLHQCDGSDRQVCSSGVWTFVETCAYGCDSGACNSPPAPSPSNPINEILTGIGQGLGSFLSAIYLPLGNLILILGIIAGVVAIFMGIAYVIRGKLK